MNMLGDTLPLIAAEKAGIIKPDTPVVVGEYQPEVADVFINKAAEMNAPLVFASEVFEVQDVTPTTGKPREFTDLLVHLKADVSNKPMLLQLDLAGGYQQHNVKTVLTAVDELWVQGFTITTEHIQTALRQVKTLTGLRGRWDVLSHMPLVIADTGHNPEGIAEVMKNIAATPYQNLHFVIGMVNDKDHSKVLALLPKNAIYYFCRPDIPRGLDAESLRDLASGFDLKGEAYSGVMAAYEAAKLAAAADDLVFVGGSTFVVAEVV